MNYRESPPLRDRVIGTLRLAGRPCTRGELSHMGCLRHKLGEAVADLQEALDDLLRDGIVHQVHATRSLAGPAPGIAWELDEQVARHKPIRLAKRRSGES